MCKKYVILFFIVFICPSVNTLAQRQIVKKAEVEEIKRTEEGYRYADLPLKAPKKKKESKKEEEQQQQQQQQQQRKTTTFQIPSIFGSGLQVIVWVLLGIALVAMIYFIVKNIDFRSSPTLDKQELEVSYDINSQSELNKLPFKDLVDKALAENDYRLAIRWYYMWVLNGLSLKEVIVYNKFKTNNEYKSNLLKELGAEHGFISIFNQCVRFYEYAWFGNLVLSKEKYDKIASQFKNALDSL